MNSSNRINPMSEPLMPIGLRAEESERFGVRIPVGKFYATNTICMYAVLKPGSIVVIFVNGDKYVMGNFNHSDQVDNGLTKMYEECSKNIHECYVLGGDSRLWKYFASSNLITREIRVKLNNFITREILKNLDESKIKRVNDCGAKCYECSASEYQVNIIPEGAKKINYCRIEPGNQNRDPDENDHRRTKFLGDEPLRVVRGDNIELSRTPGSGRDKERDFGDMCRRREDRPPLTRPEAKGLTKENSPIKFGNTRKL